MAEGSELEDGLWAIVTAASGRRLFGKITFLDGDSGPNYAYLVNLEDPVKELILHPFYEILTSTQSRPTEDGRVGIHRETMLFPPDTCVQDACIRIFAPSEIVAMQDLHAEDRKGYAVMLHIVKQQMMMGRAQRSGLVLPGQGGEKGPRA